MHTNFGKQLRVSQALTVSDPVPDTHPDTRSEHAVNRILIACLFWMLCLTLTAAGHWLYKATVVADRMVSERQYQSNGAAVVWVGHGTVADTYSRFSGSEMRAADLNLHALPNSVFSLGVVAGFTLLSGLLAWSGRYVRDNGVQSLIGLFAGHFLWLGAVEFGLDAVGRRLGLCGALEVVNGRITGTHGSGILIQMSAVFLVPILIGLSMHESNRCAVFCWLRKRLPLSRVDSASGRVDNYAARTTMQYFLTVWFCYVGVLWLADPVLGPLGEASLMLVMVAIFLATPYMIWRTTLQSGVGQSLRYSVSGAVVTWTGIEIAAAMNFFAEPWLSASTASNMILPALTVVLTASVLRVLVQRRAALIRSGFPASMILAATMLGLGGCNDGAERQMASDPESIASRLREFDERTTASHAAANDGMLRALTSESPEFAAQAAVAFGKSQKVSPIVKQQLEAMAVSDRSRLSQTAALQALSRLGLLTRRTQAVIDEFAADEIWGGIAECIDE